MEMIGIANCSTLYRVFLWQKICDILKLLENTKFDEVMYDTTFYGFLEAINPQK